MSLIAEMVEAHDRAEYHLALAATFAELRALSWTKAMAELGSPDAPHGPTGAPLQALGAVCGPWLYETTRPPLPAQPVSREHLALGARYLASEIFGKQLPIEQMDLYLDMTIKASGIEESEARLCVAEELWLARQP